MIKLTEQKLQRLIQEEATDLLSEAPEDYDQFEYKLREIRRSNIQNGLELAFKLFMAPSNPGDTQRVKRVEQQAKDFINSTFRLDVAEIYVTGQDMIIVHVKQNAIGANSVFYLMDDGIKIDLS